MGQERTRDNREAIRHEERAYGMPFRPGTGTDNEYHVHLVPSSSEIAHELTQTPSILNPAPPSNVTLGEHHAHRTSKRFGNGATNGAMTILDDSEIKLDPTSKFLK